MGKEAGCCCEVLKAEKEEDWMHQGRDVHILRVESDEDISKIIEKQWEEKMKRYK